MTLGCDTLLLFVVLALITSLRVCLVLLLLRSHLTRYVPLLVVDYLASLVKSLAQMEIDDGLVSPKYTASESGISKLHGLHFQKDLARPASTPPRGPISASVSFHLLSYFVSLY